MSGCIFTYPQASSGQHRAVSKYSLFFSSQMFNYMWEGVQMFPGMSNITPVCVHPPPSPRGLALCWRQRCPGASRLHWGSAPPGPDTAPTHTSSSSPSPGQMWRKVQTKTLSWFLALYCFPSDLLLMRGNTADSCDIKAAEWHQQTGTRLVSLQSDQLLTSFIDSD